MRNNDINANAANEAADEKKEIEDVAEELLEIIERKIPKSIIKDSNLPSYLGLVSTLITTLYKFMNIANASRQVKDRDELDELPFIIGPAIIAGAVGYYVGILIKKFLNNSHDDNILKQTQKELNNKMNQAIASFNQIIITLNNEACNNIIKYLINKFLPWQNTAQEEEFLVPSKLSYTIEDAKALYFIISREFPRLVRKNVLKSSLNIKDIETIVIQMEALSARNFSEENNDKEDTVGELLSSRQKIKTKGVSNIALNPQPSVRERITSAVNYWNRTPKEEKPLEQDLSAEEKPHEIVERPEDDINIDIPLGRNKKFTINNEDPNYYLLKPKGEENKYFLIPRDGGRDMNEFLQTVKKRKDEFKYIETNASYGTGSSIISHARSKHVYLKIENDKSRLHFSTLQCGKISLYMPFQFVNHEMHLKLLNKEIGILQYEDLKNFPGKYNNSFPAMTRQMIPELGGKIVKS